MRTAPLRMRSFITIAYRIGERAHLGATGMVYTSRSDRVPPGGERLRLAPHDKAAPPTAFDVTSTAASPTDIWVDVPAADIVQGYSKRVGGRVRWSNAVCANLRRLGPMSLTRARHTSAQHLAVDPLSCEVLANLHPYLERDLEKLVEMGRLRFSEF